VSTLAFDKQFNYSTWTIAWNASSMVQAHNGYVYVSLVNNGLYRVNTSYPTVIEKVLDGVVGMLTVDDNGDLYYASDAKLMKIDLTRKLSKSRPDACPRIGPRSGVASARGSGDRAGQIDMDSGRRRHCRFLGGRHRVGNIGRNHAPPRCKLSRLHPWNKYLS
jgi:hypothetical protein